MLSIEEARASYNAAQSYEVAADQRLYVDLLRRAAEGEIAADQLGLAVMDMSQNFDAFEADLDTYKHRRRMIALRESLPAAESERSHAVAALAAARAAHAKAIKDADSELNRARIAATSAQTRFERAEAAESMLRSSLPGWIVAEQERINAEMHALEDSAPNRSNVRRWLEGPAKAEHDALERRQTILNRIVDDQLLQPWPVPLTVEEERALLAELATIEAAAAADNEPSNWTSALELPEDQGSMLDVSEGHSPDR